jgi:UDP-N-acetylmuramyl pentapeptide phosphotransferase/UDP-N-acetylglucosamine-1-phosphate transferase
MNALILGFIVSVFVNLLVVRSANRHARPSIDRGVGPQKVHSRPVPRMGGLSLLAGVVIAFAYLQGSLSADGPTMWYLLAAALPAFLSGLVEDSVRSVSPRRRLALAAVSAALGIWLVDAVLTRTDIPVVDAALAWFPAAVALTVLVVTGVTNAINIIDGFNGLASMCVLFMLLALAYVGYQVGDQFVFLTALAFAGAVLGFFVWNYPAGLIFLGDGGAYFLGFAVAELSLLLVARNPDVSPLFPLLMCIYPVFETLFSIYRRTVVRGVAAVTADAVHLHTLVYRRIIRPALALGDDRRQTVRNSMTSPYLWVLCLVSVIPSVLWWQSSMVMAVFIALFAITYVLLYGRILRFRTPKWLLLSRRWAGSIRARTARAAGAAARDRHRQAPTPATPAIRRTRHPRPVPATARRAVAGGRRLLSGRRRRATPRTVSPPGEGR